MTWPASGKNFPIYRDRASLITASTPWSVSLDERSEHGWQIVIYLLGGFITPDRLPNIFYGVTSYWLGATLKVTNYFFLFSIKNATILADTVITFSPCKTWKLRWLQEYLFFAPNNKITQTNHWIVSLSRKNNCRRSIFIYLASPFVVVKLVYPRSSAADHQPSWDYSGSTNAVTRFTRGLLSLEDV